ncbi:MAG: prepilin peptidase, partial [Candidatus Saccharimonadales bacterium]
MIYIVLVVLGLCLGSFVNALVWRLHEQDLLASKAKAVKKQSKGKNTQLTSQDLSIVKGRSICTHCYHKLAWYDLLPVLSWASLKGKCRYCHKPIGWQYPLVELLTASVFVLSYVFWPNGLDVSSLQLALFGFWLVFVTGFMA